MSSLKKNQKVQKLQAKAIENLKQDTIVEVVAKKVKHPKVEAVEVAVVKKQKKSKIVPTVETPVEVVAEKKEKKEKKNKVDAVPTEEVKEEKKEKKEKKFVIKTKKIKSKAERLQIVDDKEKEYGIIYIGRLPYGWVEEGMKEYFTQFGDVLGVKIYRSKKTNRTQGYGFVKFENREVAQIAAETMNEYMIMGKQLVSQLLDAKHPDPFKYKHGSQKLEFINWQHRFQQESNKPKEDEEILKEVQKLLKHENEKRKKLQDQGINYTYKGFKEILAQK